MNETKIVNVGHFVVLNLKNRLKEFRNLVVQQGNAQILNELDKLIIMQKMKQSLLKIKNLRFQKLSLLLLLYLVLC